MNIKKALKSFLIYETPKLVEIKNWKIGLTERFLQLIILIYVLCWVLIYEKGYQVSDTAMSLVTTKVKGIMIKNYPSVENAMPLVADAADLVYPALENNAFFIMTNHISTLNQTATACHEVEEGHGSTCYSDSDCIRFAPSPSKIGVYTGKCLNLPSGSGVCEIYSWCPLENDTHVFANAQRTLEFIRNYTIYIKNDIEFPRFQVNRNNRQPWISNSNNRSLGSCRYDPYHPVDKFCPIFKMSTIFDHAGVCVNTIFKGGVVGIRIRWRCDLDKGFDNCNPEYSFINLAESQTKSSGFNFRYAIYYRQDGVLHRDLIKAFGIRFSIFVHATAGKFSIVPLFLNLGSGLALLGLAPLICDAIILDCVRTRKRYQEAIYEVAPNFRKIEKEAEKKCTTTQESRQLNMNILPSHAIFE